MQANSQLIIYTDLDGTLLDHHSYAVDVALPALRAAQQCSIPIVFCSSKTRAEIEAFQQELNVPDPFIVENGGALFVPKGYFPFELDCGEHRENYQIIEFGTAYEKLVAALRSLPEHLSHQLAGFSDLTAEEIALVCNLSITAARRAKAREYDEPFRFLTPSPAAALAVRQQIEQSGLHCSRGGRFWHLHGNNDKGRAIKLLSSLYQRACGRIFTIGLGDSPNDAPLLAAVNWPVLVQQPNGAFAAEIAQRLPQLNFAQASGPRGWSAAVTHVLHRIYASHVNASGGAAG
jgi:mannosyl-3-phosphoglycerate phosphatase